MTDTDTLRVQLAEALGESAYTNTLSELIRAAEQGLSEEQKRAYVQARWKLSPLSSEELWVAYWMFDQQSDEQKAAALIEVLKGGRS